MESLEGAQRVYRILSLGVPTVVIVLCTYAALVDQVFAIPALLARRILPSGFRTLVRILYGLGCLAVWGALHILLFSTCYGVSATVDLCRRDPFRHRHCLAATVASLVLLVFGAYPQRSVELYTGMRARTTLFYRLLEVAPICVAWTAAAERDASAVLLLLVLTCRRMCPAGNKISKLCHYWCLLLKFTVVVWALQAMRGACDMTQTYAVGASLAAFCA